MTGWAGAAGPSARAPWREFARSVATCSLADCNAGENDMSPTSTALADPSVEVAGAPEDVAAFCRRRGISRALHAALRLAREHFPLARRPVPEVARDPEGAEEWVFIRLSVLRDLSQDELFDRYDAYTDALLDALPPPAAELIRVSLRRG